ncbi:unnamed protein product [Adineta ricciae]|uniref:Ubiquitin fusion degradaton protein n=1 Tax=Adineta ricciae TaxID=249248 RepID=A0A813VFR8_ADIRI|nr:unnamed protein product [Adineta ricciae]CAF1042471.1 unnamed protein product [Adineta ricciae]
MFYDDNDYSSDDDNRFHAVYRCYSPAFLIDREQTTIEHGGKILLPQTALEQLIDQARIMLFKLTNRKQNRSTHCGVLEFLQSSDPVCHIPYWMMRHLSLNEGDVIHVECITSMLPASFARFQPQCKDFLDLSNPKAVLERVLRSFSCLTKGDLISINYLGRNYELAVLELKPADVVSIIECDMEVDFAPSLDQTESKSTSTTTNHQTLAKSSSASAPFHGPGNRLNGKLKDTDQEEQQRHAESSHRRGQPNYDYKWGLLQFPRAPLHGLDNDMNEIFERNTSAIFQPFTGEKKILRQLRTEQPK